MKPLSKKGQGLNLIVPAILTITLAGIVLVFGLIMMDELVDEANTDQTNSSAWDAGNETIVGMGKFGDYMDLIVLSVVITVIISLLLVVFSLRKVK